MLTQLSNLSDMAGLHSEIGELREHVESLITLVMIIERPGRAASDAVSDHVALADPHSQYAELAGGAAANFTAMPQVGGDPIVESGSNADGEWTKFSDGTLCMSSSAVGETFISNVRMNGVGTLPVAVTSIINARLFGQLDSSILAEKITLARVPLAGTSTIALRVYSANGDFVPGDETDAVINVFTFARWK